MKEAEGVKRSAKSTSLWTHELRSSVAKGGGGRRASEPGYLFKYLIYMYFFTVVLFFEYTSSWLTITSDQEKKTKRYMTVLHSSRRNHLTPGHLLHLLLY